MVQEEERIIGGPFRSGDAVGGSSCWNISQSCHCESRSEGDRGYEAMVNVPSHDDMSTDVGTLYGWVRATENDAR